MKRFFPYILILLLFSCMSSAQAVQNVPGRDEARSALEDAGHALPPAAANRFFRANDACGGMPVSSIPQTDAQETDWFENVCIMGHSLVAGMRTTLGLDMVDYYAVVGISAHAFLRYTDFVLPNGRFGTYEDALRQKSYDKIYIMLGTNDMPGHQPYLEVYREAMLELVETVQTLQPEARVYLLSIAPVGSRYMYFNSVQALQDIELYAQTLKSIARDTAVPYIDIYRDMSDADGYALSDIVAQDGLHFYKSGYEIIRDCILTHPGPAFHEPET